MTRSKKVNSMAWVGTVAGLVTLAAPGWAQNPCEDASTRLGAAGRCAVFQLGDGKVSASHGDPTGVDGDLCLGPESELSMSGGQIITGTAVLDPLVSKVPKDLDERANDVIVEDLSALIFDVEYAAAALDALACDVVFDKLKIEDSELWFATDFDPAGGEVVICVDGDLEVKGSETSLMLTGDAGDGFVFRIGGAFKVNGAKVDAVGPLSPADVLFYLQGSGKDVAYSGGGGGIGCCKAESDGTILAPDRKVALSPGRVNGQVIAGRDISLSSGSLVSCQPGSGGGGGPGA